MQYIFNICSMPIFSIEIIKFIVISKYTSLVNVIKFLITKIDINS